MTHLRELQNSVSMTCGRWLIPARESRKAGLLRTGAARSFRERTPCAKDRRPLRAVCLRFVTWLENAANGRKSERNRDGQA